MRLKSKRLVSLLLAGSMMVSMVPASAVTAFAAETSNVAVMAAVAKQDIPADGACSVEITRASDTEEDVNAKTGMSGVEKALVEKYNIGIGDGKYDSITSLAIKTAPGIELDKMDYQFMTGVKVENDKGIYAGEEGTAYAYLRKLTELDMTEAKCTNDEIPTRVFNNNAKLETIFLPNTLVSAGYKSFCYMNAVSYIGTKEGKASNTMTFPETLTKIDNASFYHDPSLACKVELPESITYLGQGAFENTPITGNIVIRSNVTMESDGNYLFRGTKINSIKIEDGVKAIGRLAFHYDPNQFGTREINETIVIPESVEKIGESAFYNTGSNVKNIIVGNKDVALDGNAFALLSAKIYFKSAVANSGTVTTSNGPASGVVWSNTATILNTNDGTIETDSNGNVTAKLDSTTELYIPTKEGYRFDGWYYTATNGKSVKLEAAAEAGKTYTAKWHKYSAEIDTEEKTTDTKVSYIGTPVDIAVEVNAEEADANSIKLADLIFDDVNAVEKVEVNGKTLDTYTNIDLYGLMNKNQDVATLAMVPVTEEPVILSVTFNTPGEHNVKIVLKDDEKNVICSQDTTVKVVEKPILTFSDDCVVKVNGDEIKSGAEVEIGATVTVNLAKDVDSGMKFGSYVIDPVPEKVEYNDTTATFAMPAKNTSITLHLDPADTEDDSWDAATVVTGVAIGAGAAVLTYHIGTELYAKQVLGEGVAVPKTREEVALKAWELAGKPAVAIDGDPLSEAAQAEKWAVESGLMQNVDGSFNGAKKMSKLKALRVLDAAKKLG